MKREMLPEAAVTVSAARGSYPVYIGPSLLPKLGTLAAANWRGRRVLVVSDGPVAELYLETCCHSLAAAGFEAHPLMIPTGEASKNMDTLLSTYAACHRAGLSREDGIVALGGGVVGDVAGLAAATYLRGLGLIQIPTTLLAQVDASVGGKTAIDLPYGKNMVGTIYPAQAVLCDTDVLNTLPARRLAEGMAEVVKYGAVLDAALFEILETGNYRLIDLVRRSVELKARIVAVDEQDLGERRLLNFGHTLGHALELVSGFAPYTHGEAVAMGMVAAVHIGKALQVTPPAVEPRLVRLLEGLGLPTELPIKPGKLLGALYADKKRQGSTIPFILLNDLGKGVIHSLTPPRLIEVLEECSHE